MQLWCGEIWPGLKKGLEQIEAVTCNLATDFTPVLLGLSRDQENEIENTRLISLPLRKS